MNTFGTGTSRASFMMKEFNELLCLFSSQCPSDVTVSGQAHQFSSLFPLFK